jgi:hypothetical protein
MEEDLIIYKKEFTNNLIKNENSLIQLLIKKRNKKLISYNEDLEMLEDECIIDSIIKLIEKKNKEIEQLKAYSIFDIIKYNSIVSV